MRDKLTKMKLWKSSQMLGAPAKVIELCKLLGFETSVLNSFAPPLGLRNLPTPACGATLSSRALREPLICGVALTHGQVRERDTKSGANTATTDAPVSASMAASSSSPSPARLTVSLSGKSSDVFRTELEEMRNKSDEAVLDYDCDYDEHDYDYAPTHELTSGEEVHVAMVQEAKPREEDEAKPKEEAPPAVPAAAVSDAERFAELIRGVYVRRSPENVERVTNLVAKYAGQERLLYESVCVKYGETPVSADAQVTPEPVAPETLRMEESALPEATPEANTSERTCKDVAAGDAETQATVVEDRTAEETKAVPATEAVAAETTPAATTTATPAALAATYEELICDVYKRHKPDKLMDVKGLLLKWPGQEQMLYERICLKYCDPEVQVAERQEEVLQERQVAERQEEVCSAIDHGGDASHTMTCSVCRYIDVSYRGDDYSDADCPCCHTWLALRRTVPATVPMAAAPMRPDEEAEDAAFWANLEDELFAHEH